MMTFGVLLSNGLLTITFCVIVINCVIEGNKITLL